MVRASVAIVSLVLVAPLLAGCFSKPTAAASDPLVRTVRLDLDPAKAPAVDSPAAFLRLAKTTFTYTQGSGDLDVGGVTVAFTDPDGKSVVHPLSDFTSKATLATGDAVSVTGAAFTSGFTVSQGSTVLASRMARTAPWLTVAGTPVPLSAADGAGATFDLDSKATLGFSFDRLATPGDQPSNVTDAKLDAHSTTAGHLTLGAHQEGSALNVSLQAHTQADATMTATATVESSDGSGPAGAKYSAQDSADGLAAMRFADGALTQVGAGGTVHADATFEVRKPGDADYAEQPDAHHPALDRTEPFTWQPAPTDEGDALPAQVRDFLVQLYGLSLAPGDRFTVHAGTAGSEAGGEVTYDVTVAAAQDRTVAGHAFHALKLLGTYSLALRLDGKADTARSFAFTYWIDADSMLPLEMTWEADVRFSQDDLAEIWSAARAFGADTRLPSSLDLEATAAGSVKLSSFAPGFQTSALDAVGGATGLYLPVAALSYGMMSDLGRAGHDATPLLTFNQDQTTNRLTIVAASNDYPYSSLQVSSSAPTSIAFNASATSDGPMVGPGEPLDLAEIAGGGDVHAGDFLQVCGDGPTELTVLDLPTNTMLGTWHFDLQPCS